MNTRRSSSRTGTIIEKSWSESLRWSVLKPDLDTILSRYSFTSPSSISFRDPVVLQGFGVRWNFWILTVKELCSLDELSHYNARLAELRCQIESRVCKHADGPSPHQAGSLG